MASLLGAADATGRPPQRLSQLPHAIEWRHGSALLRAPDRTKLNAPNEASALYCQLGERGRVLEAGADHRAEPREAEGLGDQVVGTGEPRALDVRVGGQRCEDEHRHRLRLLAATGCGGTPRSRRRPASSRRGSPGRTVRCRASRSPRCRPGCLCDFESFHAEIQPDDMQQSRFVVSEKDALLGQRSATSRARGQVVHRQYRATGRNRSGRPSFRHRVATCGRAPWRLRSRLCWMMWSWWSHDTRRAAKLVRSVSDPEAPRRATPTDPHRTAPSGADPGAAIGAMARGGDGLRRRVHGPARREHRRHGAAGHPHQPTRIHRSCRMGGARLRARARRARSPPWARSPIGSAASCSTRTASASSWSGPPPARARRHSVCWCLPGSYRRSAP